MPDIGLRSRFAFVIGPPDPDRPTTGLRIVDLYAAGRWLTCADHHAHVPTFAESVRRTIDYLRDGGAADRFRLPFPDLSAAEMHRRFCDDPARDSGPHWFMYWGPTTDNVRAHLFLDNGVARIAFSFWWPDHLDPSEVGQVFVAELPIRELNRTLHEAAWTLMLGLE